MVVASGCYGTTTVPLAQLASVEHPLTAPLALPGNVRLGPRTEVRARFPDGSVTAWWPAGRLLLSDDGLVLPAARPRHLHLGVLDDDGAADAVLWRDVWSLELHNLDAARTAGAVVAAPVAASLMLLAALGTASAIVDGEDPTPSLVLGAEVATAADAAVESADSEANPGYAPERMPDDRVAALLAAGPSHGRGALVPLFSDRARRRDDLKLVLSGEGGITGTGTFTGGLGLGLRLFDFVELTARVRALPFAEATLAEATADSPSLTAAAVPSSSWPRLLFGGRAALHVDGDGDPHSAFVLGGEFLAGHLASGAELTELGLVIGPRIGIGDTAFVSLLFTPSLLLIGDGPGAVASTAGQFMLTAELGFGL